MRIDTTVITIWGIPPYIFFVGIGAVLAFFVFNCLLLHLKADMKFGNRAVVLSIPAMFIGAKLFGIIANLVESIAYNVAINFDTFLYSGIVFYGGLIFFLICFLLLMHKNTPQERNKITDSLAVSIPLFHTFGRVGCFFAGCCYGISTESVIGVAYTTWVNGTELTAQRIPIQLIEASLNLLLFALLLWMVLHKKQDGKLLMIYVILYGSIRFIDEFFRGDIDKSILCGFSAAQVISIILIMIVSIKLIRERKNKNVQ